MIGIIAFVKKYNLYIRESVWQNNLSWTEYFLVAWYTLATY